MVNNSLFVILPGVVVMVAALVVFVTDLFVARKGALAYVAALGLVAAAGTALGQWVTFSGGLHLRARQPEVGFARMVVMDKYALYFTLLFCAVGVLTVMVSDAYLREHKAPAGEFYGLLLLIIAGMIGMAISTDVIALFISFELMSLPTYVMAGFLRGSRTSGEAAIKYFVNGAFSSAILLFGLALLYGLSGGTNYADIAAGLANAGARNGIAIVALVLVATGFGFKISAVPFHGWAPDVYEGAPTPVTAFMAVGVKAGAFAGLVKLFTVAALPDWSVWSNILIVLAVLTMVVGNVLALPQRNLKRMLAYSSIAHAGYLLLGVIAVGHAQGDPHGSSAVLFYLAAYAVMNLGAFGLLVFVRNRQPGFRYTLDEMAGTWRQMPWAAIALTLFMLSLAGIPPTIGFWGKFYIFTAVIDAGLTWLAIIAVVMAAVSAFYYLRVVWYVFFREQEEGAQPAPALLSPTPGISTAMGLTAVGVLALGVYPSGLLSAAQGALRLLIGG
jgi:NADH-quinone oxidoreductase subunit N